MIRVPLYFCTTCYQLQNQFGIKGEDGSGTGASFERGRESLVTSFLTTPKYIPMELIWCIQYELYEIKRNYFHTVFSGIQDNKLFFQQLN